MCKKARILTEHEFCLAPAKNEGEVENFATVCVCPTCICRCRLTLLWIYSLKYFFLFYWLLQHTCGFEPLHSWGFEITHSDTTLSVGLLWTSDRSVAETSTWQTHDTHNRQTSMPSAGFEPAIPAGERLQTHALDRSATGIGICWNSRLHFIWLVESDCVPW